jgi:hypothetical protein
VIIVNAIILEALGYFASSRLLYSGVFYDSSSIIQSYSEYLRKRDPALGWLPQNRANDISGAEIELDGSKKDPLFGISEKACISMFGDSFTWAAEVPNDRGWVSLLSRKLGCRVANFGVSAYGTDQSLLRYESLQKTGDFVFLNHLSENIIRNVNQFRNFIYPGAEFVLKPRFIYKNGVLELISMPDFNIDEASVFLQNPSQYLSNEWFLPDGKSGIVNYKFPYSFQLFKAVLRNYHIRAKFRGDPRHSEFYDYDHPSQALKVTEEIFKRFESVAAIRSQTAIFTIIPTCDDLKYFQRNGYFVYEPLTFFLDNQQWLHIDFGKSISERLNGRSPDSLYISCSGHFNESGYALLAEITSDFIDRHQLLVATSKLSATKKPGMKTGTK